MQSSATSAPRATRPPVLAAVLALIAWLGLQFLGVGIFDRSMLGSQTGEWLIRYGSLFTAIGSLGLVALRFRKPLVGFQLVILCFGVTPFTLFSLFIGWRIAVSQENIAKCRNEADVLACRTVAEVRAKRGKNEEAIELFKIACAKDDARSCRELGGQARHFPERVAQPPHELYIKACSLGDAIGCDRASHELRASDPERALEFQARACELGQFSACSGLP